MDGGFEGNLTIDDVDVSSLNNDILECINPVLDALNDGDVV